MRMQLNEVATLREQTTPYTLVVHNRGYDTQIFYCKATTEIKEK